MTYQQRLQKQQATIKRWMKYLEEVEAQVAWLMEIIPKGNQDHWLVTAREALQNKRDGLAHSRIMRPITETMVKQLRQVAKCRTKDGWYWPSTSKDKAIPRDKRCWVCSELQILGFLKQKRHYYAFKITNKGLRYLKELRCQSKSTTKI